MDDKAGWDDSRIPVTRSLDSPLRPPLPLFPFKSFMQPYWWYLLNSSWIYLLFPSPPRTPDLQLSPGWTDTCTHTHTPTHHSQSMVSFLSLLCSHSPSLPASSQSWRDLSIMRSFYNINQGMSLFWIKSLSGLPLPLQIKSKLFTKAFKSPSYLPLSPCSFPTTLPSSILLQTHCPLSCSFNLALLSLSRMCFLTILIP